MNRVFALLSLAIAIGVAGLLYLTTNNVTQDDPCLQPQNDISGAILGDAKDQDALANRAMLQRKLCEDQRRAADSK